MLGMRLIRDIFPRCNHLLSHGIMDGVPIGIGRMVGIPVVLLTRTQLGRFVVPDTNRHPLPRPFAGGIISEFHNHILLEIFTLFRGQDCALVAIAGVA